MATTLAAANKIAQPTIAGKFAALAGGVALGGAAIVTKNASGNLSANVGKKSNFTPDAETIANLLNMPLTGNDLYDLLQYTHFFNKLSLVFIWFLLYYFVILQIDERKIDRLIAPIKNNFFIKYLTRFIFYAKKSSLFLIITLLLLLLISNYLSYYYTGIIMADCDKICEIYILKK